VPALPSFLIEPIWQQVAALLPDVGAQPRLGPVVDGTHLQVDRLQAAEGTLHVGQALVGRP
jgi:hypothetical protein